MPKNLGRELVLSKFQPERIKLNVSMCDRWKHHSAAHLLPAFEKQIYTLDSCAALVLRSMFYIHRHTGTFSFCTCKSLHSI